MPAAMTGLLDIHAPASGASWCPPEGVEAPELVVYGAAGCCLCDEAMPVLDVLARALHLRVRHVAIDGDAELEARWRERIPAGELDGRLVFKFRPDPAVLVRQAARSWADRGVEIGS